MESVKWNAQWGKDLSMRDILMILLLGVVFAVLVQAWLSVESVRDQLSTGVIERASEAFDMTATYPYTSNGNRIEVTTTRGVASPGDGEVPSDETTAAWRARHLARIAASQEVFPED